MKVRISLGRGWEYNQQSYKVEYEITTRNWPWSKEYKRWSHSRSFDFNQYNQEKKDEALDAATDWAFGIMATGDPNIAEIIEMDELQEIE